MLAPTTESSLQSSEDPDDETVQTGYLQIKIARKKDYDGCEEVQTQRGVVFLVVEMAETG